jgi:alkanesulfonate monooxygenase SsuD/methylene tetrahydromethanopterin reductase-like flavin-dependent oxidoreductase (luciferase family)
VLVADSHSRWDAGTSTEMIHLAEDAGAADLIAGGRLQLGISRGSPEQVIDGWRYFA